MQELFGGEIKIINIIIIIKVPLLGNNENNVNKLKGFIIILLEKKVSGKFKINENNAL
jgi:hypothetical protein